MHQYDRLIVGSLSQPLGAKIGMRTGEHTQGRRGGGAGGHHHSAQGSWKSNASAASIATSSAASSATSSTGPAAHAELRFGAVDAVLAPWLALAHEHKHGELLCGYAWLTAGQGKNPTLASHARDHAQVHTAAAAS